MRYAGWLASRFGGFLVISSLGVLSLLIYTQHFGVAQEFANYFLLLTIIIVSWRVVKSRNSILEKVSKDGSERKSIFLLLGWFGVIAVALLVFKYIYIPGPSSWGDSPYYFPEAFKEFFPEPLVWQSRGRLGIVNDLYWIYPLMFVYQWLGTLGLSNDIIIRLLFHLPAILLTLVSPWFLTRYLKYSRLVSLFAVLVYGLNTYFILVVDGGQVGVALAYGLFPLALLELFKLRDKKTFNQFYLTLSLFMLLVIADVRFALMAIFTFLVWIIFEHVTQKQKLDPKFWRIFTIFIVVIIALSSYWLIPSVLLKPTTGSGARSDLQLISALNPLLLFSPHWPLNEFGKISQPFWYFLGIPFLIFTNLFFKNKRLTAPLILIFLMFVFIVKGDTGIFGNLYAWVIDRVPLAGAFRDSTKFFTPLILVAGILIGLAVQNLQSFFKNSLLSKAIPIIVFVYLIYLIHPALSGRMHGVLEAHKFPSNLQVIADNFTEEKEFFRSVWLPEWQALSFSTERKPALDGKGLINLRIFASLNTGTLDTFNFFQKDESIDGLRLLGVKYLILSGNVRSANSTSDEREDWSNLVQLVSKKEQLQKVDWGTDIPVFKVNGSMPRIFGVKRTLAVIGSDDIYSKLKQDNSDFSLSNQGIVFLEDGKVSPSSLADIPAGSTVLVFNKKSEDDLIFSFLQKYFISPSESKTSGWAIRSEYLRWKYELLTKNIDTHEFDYGRGIAFSSQGNEKIIFKVNVSKEDKYVLAIRSMGDLDGKILTGAIDGKNFEIIHKSVGEFGWFTLKDLNLSVGEHEITLENPKGLQVLNTVALIPNREWEDALKMSHKLISAAKIVNIEDKTDLKDIALDSVPVSYEQISPVEYKVSVPPEAKWIIFTDTYHNDWELVGGELGKSYPFYSMINGFYVPTEGEYRIIFKEQQTPHIALLLSLFSLAALALIYVSHKVFRKTK